MTHQPTAPSEADALRPWARAILHARISVLLKLVLLALFAAVTMADAPRRTLRLLRKDWLFSTNSHFTEDLDSAQGAYALRRLLQLRAELGWLMRGAPNRGMRLSARHAPGICPEPAARAPPPGEPVPQLTPNPSRKPRLARRRLMPAARPA